MWNQFLSSLFREALVVTSVRPISLSDIEDIGGYSKSSVYMLLKDESAVLH